MPAKIDRIGRAHEWLTAALLNKKAGREAEAKECLTTAEKYILTLPEVDQLRVRVASERAAEYIETQFGARRIAETTVVGEESKKPGSAGDDLRIRFQDQSEIGLSLKLQTGPNDVNFRNPTINSLARYVTGDGFDARLTEAEKKWYAENGRKYQVGEAVSQPIGAWGARKLAVRFEEAKMLDPAGMVDRLLAQMRARERFLLTVVDGRGRFLGQTMKHDPVISEARKDPEGVEFRPHGVSTHISHRGRPIGRVDNYMQSGSNWKGKKLRCAIRRDFELDEASKGGLGSPVNPGG
jgi:hypothetical protein